MKVKVYWVNSGGTVGFDEAVRFTKTTVHFADGGWNPIGTTFLTEAQARRAARLPERQPKVRKASVKAALLMNKAIDLIEDALDKEPEESQ